MGTDTTDANQTVDGSDVVVNLLIGSLLNFNVAKTSQINGESTLLRHVFQLPYPLLAVTITIT